MIIYRPPLHRPLGGGATDVLVAPPPLAVADEYSMTGGMGHGTGSAADLPASARAQGGARSGMRGEEVNELMPVLKTAAGDLDLVEPSSAELDALTNESFASTLIDDALFSILPAPGQSWDDWESKHYSHTQPTT